MTDTGHTPPGNPRVMLFTYGADSGAPMNEVMRIQMARKVTRMVAEQLAVEGDPAESALELAGLAKTLRLIAEHLVADAGAIAVLNDVSVRRVAEAAGIRHATMRRALARSPTLEEHAEGEGVARAVSTRGISQAREDIQEGRTGIAAWIDAADLPEGAALAWNKEMDCWTVPAPARPADSDNGQS